MKKLKDPQRSTDKFFAEVRGLKQKLGPILFQLPPHWRVNAERLSTFVKELPPEYRYTFEFRDPSWFCDPVYKILDAARMSVCIYDLAGFQSPVRLSAPFVYLRLHGPGEKYRGSYPDCYLRELARKIVRWRQDRDVFCYFDNDEKAFAVQNALTLQGHLGIARHGRRQQRTNSLGRAAEKAKLLRHTPPE